jgi:putative methionine-R-sulfoxide reductase with GAF domain
MTHTSSARDCQSIELSFAPGASRDQRLHAVVDALWRAFASHGYSWVGFYLPQQTETGHTQLVLGPCRNKPACSPIGLHGVCGQSLQSGETRIIRDVSELGPNYIACDPRDRSEIVVPCFDAAGQVWAVLDVDSWEVGAFGQHDADGLNMLLRRAALST